MSAELRPTPFVGVEAKPTAKAAHRDELLSLIASILPVIESEVGTLVCPAYTSDQALHEVHVYELYRDRHALKLHATNDAIRATTSLSQDVLAKPVEVVVTTVPGGKGLPALGGPF